VPVNNGRGAWLSLWCRVPGGRGKASSAAAEGTRGGGSTTNMCLSVGPCPAGTPTLLTTRARTRSRHTCTMVLRSFTSTQVCLGGAEGRGGGGAVQGGRLPSRMFGVRELQQQAAHNSRYCDIRGGLLDEPEWATLSASSAGPAAIHMWKRNCGLLSYVNRCRTS